MVNLSEMRRSAAMDDLARSGKVSSCDSSDGEVVILKDAWKQYCKSTSLHGIRYIAEEGRTTIERVFWVAALCLSFIGCAVLITRMYYRWEASPSVMSNEIKLEPIWNIPFPAITVCPNIKSTRSLFNFSDAYLSYLSDPAENCSDVQQRDGLSVVSLVCDEHQIIGGKSSISEEEFEFLQEVAPQRNDSIAFCKYFNENPEEAHNCTQFYPIMTEEGVCYTFNMLRRDELFTASAFPYSWSAEEDAPPSSWTLQGGYTAGESWETYPKRALSSGAKWGVFIVLRARTEDMDYMCRGPVQGFKVMLHNPDELPHMRKDFFPVSVEEEVVVTVKASKMTTSPGLHSSSKPSLRRCYFPNERQLQFFQVYSQKNCELECASNFSKTFCQCVAFYMPRSKGTPICGLGSSDCLRRAEEKMVTREIERGERGLEDENSDQDCHCLPACTTLKYEINAGTTAEYSYDKVFEAFKVKRSAIQDLIPEGFQMGRVAIYFKENQVTITQRNELYTIESFIAGCANLLGLFCGFSIVNLIEVIYFVSLRLLVNAHKIYIKETPSPNQVRQVEPISELELGHV